MHVKCQEKGYHFIAFSLLSYKIFHNVFKINADTCASNHLFFKARHSIIPTSIGAKP